MRKKLIFKGVGTAVITPFLNGEIDFGALGRIIERQISAGINALIIGGTTGEASTLSDRERSRLYSYAKEVTEGKIPLILGTGSNSTAKAVEYTKEAKRLGADGALVVTPYYNKGTEEGIFKHYAKIAEEGDLPIILYNVPGRTGVNLSLNNLTRLAAYDNIVAIKEASGSYDRLIRIAGLSEELALYSGNDSEAYITLALGGAGVISVASNPLPRAMLKITNSFFSGELDKSYGFQKALLPFIEVLFKETNPAPVKYAMSLCGLCSGELRLPMAEISDATKAEVLREYGRATRLIK